MRTKLRIESFFFLLCLCPAFLFAQRSNIKDYVRIEIVPSHDNWTYIVGEKAHFTVRVVRANVPVKDVPLTYEIGPEKMKPALTGKSDLRKGSLLIDAGTMKSPGFMTCLCKTEVDGIKYSNYVNIGFSPEKIEPTTTLPKDFSAFWDKAKAENAQIPMEPLVTLLPGQCTPDVNVYQVRMQHYKKNSYLYGLLCIPVKPGKYPAVLRVPGAGVKKNPAEMFLAGKGMITLSIGIHGIPLTMDESVYKNLNSGVLNNYAFFNLDDKDYYYYRRVYTGCVRALDFLCSLPGYDGENLGVIGGSQGGALAMVTAGLDPRVKALVAFYPALCDLTGYLYGRAGGWPQMFAPQNEKLNNKPEKIETSKYYDVVNFARFIKAPGYYSWGYNDPTCAPTSIFSAYNVVTAPKQLFVAHDNGHWRTKEQDMITNDWFCGQLLGDGSTE